MSQLLFFSWEIGTTLRFTDKMPTEEHAFSNHKAQPKRSLEEQAGRIRYLWYGSPREILKAR